MPEEMTFSALCDRLEELVASEKSLTVVAAICATGADPESVRLAFEHLQSRGSAKLVGGTHRGWSLVRKVQ